MNTLENHNETLVRDLGITIPTWIEQDITVQDVIKISRGEIHFSEAYSAGLPDKACKAVAQHGGKILRFIEYFYGYVPTPGREDSIYNLSSGDAWSNLCVYYLSQGVFFWATLVLDQLKNTPDAA